MPGGKRVDDEQKGWGVAQTITAKADDLMIAIVGQCAAYTQGIIYFEIQTKSIYLEKSGCRIRPGFGGNGHKLSFFLVGLGISTLLFITAC